MALKKILMTGEITKEEVTDIQITHMGKCLDYFNLYMGFHKFFLHEPIKWKLKTQVCADSSTDLNFTAICLEYCFHTLRSVMILTLLKFHFDGCSYFCLVGKFYGEMHKCCYRSVLFTLLVGMCWKTKRTSLYRRVLKSMRVTSHTPHTRTQKNK